MDDGYEEGAVVALGEDIVPPTLVAKILLL